MKARFIFMKKVLIFASLLTLVLHPFAIGADKNNLPAILYLLNSNTTVENIVEKAVAKFGNQINASMAVLLSGDQGYSWSQIFDAIEQNTLNADGSITGVSPQGPPIGQIIFNNAPAIQIEYETLRDRLLDYEETDIFVLILATICWGYSPEQITTAIIEGIQWKTEKGDLRGLLVCPYKEIEERDEFCEVLYGRFYLKGANITDKPRYCSAFSDLPSVTPHIKGVWQGGGSVVTICQKGDGVYSYSGTNGLYKHDGTIYWWGQDQWYEGRVVDDPDFCCGNNGIVYVRKIDDATLEIKSKWYAPDGSLLKEVDWDYLYFIRPVLSADCSE